MKAPSLTFPVILLLVLAFAATDSFAAANLIVTKTEDTADAICDDDCSLREAIAAAASGDTIVFSDLFNTPQTITLIKGQIEITESLTITGPGSGLLSISGNNAGRIFLVQVSGRVVALSGMHLRNARNITSSSGGAIAIANGSLTLTELVFRDNYVRFDGSTIIGAGSAIFAFQSNVVISNFSFYNNSADGGTVDGLSGSNIDITNSSVSDNQGGGVGGLSVRATYVLFHGNSGGGVGGGDVILQHCTVTSNRNGGVASSDTLVIDNSRIAFNQKFNSFNQSGGGIGNSGYAVITNSTIANNRVNGNAGGIRNHGTMYISNSSILNNEGGTSSFADATGGGIYNSSGDLYLTNTTVSGNQAVWGAGVFNRVGARIFLTNSTIAFNSSGIGAGGVVNELGATANLRNSIIDKNTQNLDLYDISGAVVSQGFNMIGPQNDSIGWLASDMIGVINPFLAPLGSNGGTTLTHALYPNSPAINAGSNSLAVDPLTKLALTTDQRGSVREAGGTVDIGAYEANYSSSPVSLTGRLVTSTGRGIASGRVTLTGQLGELRYAITNPFGYYRFLNLPAGITYTVTAADKLFTFASPITLTTDQDRDDLIFFGMF